MATRLSDAQRRTLTIITGGGCTAVEQVYGTIGANARSEYRDAKGNRLDGRTVGSLVRRGLVEMVNPRERGAFRIEALTVPASNTPEPAAPVEYPIVDRTNEAPACASAVRMGDRARLADGNTGTVTYVERFHRPYGDTIEIELDGVTGGPDGPHSAMWRELRADERITIIFRRPLVRSVAA
ncbi:MULTISPECIES: hypothetical protein [unclassified Pseudofrankia]|uniref:hypothetical protein n=1 Tax=unclassified Pseudofrankia TaxID=2994372 RepID=UPI0008D9740B|nr:MULTISPECIES: hypothetical protein [unclassified Pseudofrankia]MDT3444209.1 hypothetical protein [Pseudofrankia sp. BMG5.37]OHV65228.1 hypothetical protein BCD48_03730 [Pseudofrankia sp. BMG5.36]